MRRTTSSGPGGRAVDLEPRGERRRVDVERVLRHPRRVAGRVVERGEVVVVELDLGPLHHPVAEADEDVLDLALGAHEQVLRRARRRRGARHRDVDRAGGQRALELRAPRARPRVRRARPRAPCARRSRSEPTGAALGGPEVGDPAQDRGQLRLAAQVADPQLLELAGVGGRGDRRRGLLAQAFDPLNHQAADDIRPMAMAAAAATFSDSTPSRSGIVHSRSQRGRELLREPLALARRRMSAPTGPSSGGAPPWATRPTTGARAQPGSPRRDRHARRSSPCSPAPPSGRTGPRSPARARPSRRPARRPCGRSRRRCPGRRPRAE